METATICLGCMAEKGVEQVCPHCGYAEGTPAASPVQLKPGTIINGKYLIGRTLGQGGFGITYLAYDTTLHVKLAIKEYFPSGLVTRDTSSATISVYTGDKKASFDYGLEKFLDEGRTLARFGDVPEVVSISDFFMENGTAYLVMSYVEGITLKEYLARQGGRLPLDAVLTFMLPVIKALEKVHAMGILHRDISPDNIFLTADYNVRLLDFGAARYAMGEQSRSLSIMLKPGFSPEEQYRSRGRQGPWTDIYATAATMYKLLTGEAPPESMDRMVEDDIKPFSEFGIVLPENYERAIMKALSVRAADRYAEMTEFEAVLMSGVTQENGKTQITSMESKADDKATSTKLEEINTGGGTSQETAVAPQAERIIPETQNAESMPGEEGGIKKPEHRINIWIAAAAVTSAVITIVICLNVLKSSTAGIKVTSSVFGGGSSSLSGGGSTPSKSTPSKSTPSKSTPSKSTPSKPAQSKPAQSKPTQSKPAQSKPAQSKPTPIPSKPVSNEWSESPSNNKGKSVDIELTHVSYSGSSVNVSFIIYNNTGSSVADVDFYYSIYSAGGKLIYQGSCEADGSIAKGSSTTFTDCETAAAKGCNLTAGVSISVSNITPK